MSQLDRPRRAPRLCLIAYAGLLAWAFFTLAPTTRAADAGANPKAHPAAKQAAGPSAAGSSAADKAADQALNAAAGESAGKPVAKSAAKPSDEALFATPAINWFALLWKGGPLMIPIGLTSVVVVAFAIERMIGLRRKKVNPRKFVTALGVLAASPGGFDPRKAYRLCQQFPSSASNVVRAMLLKIGRPADEVEHAATDSIARETWKLNYNVRPISLAVTVAPLLGLLGTVQGMIIAFFVTAHTPVGQDRALVLADGIYLKLITTGAGLLVAIPALIIAHYFEGRIQALMREVEDLLQGLLPQVEKYEGKLRITRQSVGGVEPPPVLKTDPVAEAAFMQAEGV